MTIAASLFKRRFPLLLERIGRSEVDILLDVLVRVEVAPGAVLVQCGQRAESLFLIWEGALTLSTVANGQDIVLGTLGPGQHVGVAAVVEPGPAMATVAAARPSVVLRLDYAGLVIMRATHPRLAGNLLRALSLDLVDWLRAFEDYMAHRGQTRNVEDFVKLGRKLMGIKAEDL
ncbi:MAG: cyclic nucleotide-binding domain-containing protein [Pseudomonadota bacterium]|nr:cyclic nucleotide-binding domain-containing protein [Pseudomonadota bacterium]